MKLIFAAAILLSGMDAWAVNKCTGPHGAVVFQDAPCTGKGETVRITGAGKADPSSPGAQYWQREAARQKQRALTDEHVANGRVAIGMRSTDVVASWGDPSKINRTITAGGTREQWVYSRGNYKNQYVYVENGVVTAVQSAE